MLFNHANEQVLVDLVKVVERGVSVEEETFLTLLIELEFRVFSRLCCESCYQRPSSPSVIPITAEISNGIIGCRFSTLTESITNRAMHVNAAN